MKLLVQIPCYNEAATLPATLGDIPKKIDGIDSIEILIIDDGSTDETAKVAREHGVHYVIRNTGNLGLAHSFRRGIDESLKRGADFIVNLDGDNQYRGSDIPLLLQPLLNGEADMAIGDRQTNTVGDFSLTKKILQRIGSMVVGNLSQVPISDATSGFRAFTKSAALKLTILSNYTYTLETILQCRSKGLIVKNIKVTTNSTTRPSRLMSSIRSYLVFSAATIIRVFTMYNPLRVFLDLGILFIFAGLAIAGRFLFFYFTTGARGHVQSLIFAAIFTIVGITVVLVGLLADLIQFNRRLLENILERVRRLELKERES